MAQQELSASSAIVGDSIPIFEYVHLSREIDENKRGLTPGLQKFLATSPAGLGISRFIIAVLQHLQFLQRDETAIHHSVKDWQKFINLLFGIHDFDDQGQI